MIGEMKSRDLPGRMDRRAGEQSTGEQREGEQGRTSENPLPAAGVQNGQAGSIAECSPAPGFWFKQGGLSIPTEIVSGLDSRGNFASKVPPPPSAIRHRGSQESHKPPPRAAGSQPLRGDVSKAAEATWSPCGPEQLGFTHPIPPHPQLRCGQCDGTSKLDRA